MKPGFSQPDAPLWLVIPGASFTVIGGSPEVCRILGLPEPSAVPSPAGVPATGIVFSSPLFSFLDLLAMVVLFWFSGSTVGLAAPFCLRQSTFCWMRCLRRSGKKIRSFSSWIRPTSLLVRFYGAVLYWFVTQLSRGLLLVFLPFHWCVATSGIRLFWFQVFPLSFSAFLWCFWFCFPHACSVRVEGKLFEVSREKGAAFPFTLSEVNKRRGVCHQASVQ